MRLHNTLTGKQEAFAPPISGPVKMYHCGPTVYGTQHIGNLSMYVFTDVLRRTLEHEGLEVKQVINFTDFGHLSGDNIGNPDEGEDKMTKGLKTENLEPSLENMKKLGQKYAGIFLEDIAKLNIRTTGTHFPYASDYIVQQIELIQTLEKKGYTYPTNDGLYFDTTMFPGYGKLGGLSGLGDETDNQSELQSRVGQNDDKRNQRDFALWKLGDLGWESPWGKGFPGWHIECSAMILDILGEQIDIHTGGIEHIAIHHNNEIAQSEAATGQIPFSRFWLHRAHLQIDGQKIAKSVGNVVLLSEIEAKGFSPLALRYLLLGANYRTPTNFTWESLEAAESAYKRLKLLMKMFSEKAEGEGKVDENYKQEFTEALENDLNTPEALAVVWKMSKFAGDSLSCADARATLLNFDQILGLKLDENEFEIKDIPSDIEKLLKERETARTNKNWKRADELRQEILKLGWRVSDTENGQELLRI